MGSSLSTHSCRTKRSDRYNLLICGYLRNTCVKIKHSAKLLRICANFYCLKTNSNLLIWSGTKEEGNKACNGLSLINISNYSFNKKKKNSEIYRFNIHNLDDNNFCGVEWNENFDKINSAYSLITNIQKLPKWITNRYTKTFNHKKHIKASEYNMIVRIGCDDSNKSRCDMMIFNANNVTSNANNLIQSYYISKVDTFPKMPFITNTNIISNHMRKNDGDPMIFGYGGKKRNNQIWNNIYSVNMSSLECRKYCQLSKPKSGVTLGIDNNNNMLLFGGIFGGKSQKTCDILQLDNNLCIQIRDMSYCRMYAGFTHLNNDNNKIIVGGGCLDGNTMEIFDINKNKWKLLQCKTNKTHFNYPLIWNDTSNNSIIYIGGNKTRNETVKDLGFIEWCDIRENKPKFNVLFNNEPINHLFGLTKKNNTDKKNWISRALLI